MPSQIRAEQITFEITPSWVIKGTAATLVSTISQTATRQAITDMRAGNYAAAVASLTGIVDSTGDWACHFWLAVAYMSGGNRCQARHQFLHVAERCPTAELRKLAMGMLLVIERAEAY